MQILPPIKNGNQLVFIYLTKTIQEVNYIVSKTDLVNKVLDVSSEYGIQKKFKDILFQVVCNSI